MRKFWHKVLLKSVGKNGPFGHELFADPTERALSKVGVVDVGSNSVRMVVFDGAARSPAYFFNEKVMCGLGKDLAQTGKLNAKGRERALAALRRFAVLAKGMGIETLTVVGTAAVREATDGAEFHAQVLRETGLTILIVDGDEEARLSAQGVLLGWPEAAGVVCDIGGNSMELARIGGGTVGARLSTPLGPFRLQQHAADSAQRAVHIRNLVKAAVQKLDCIGQPIYLVGGSWRVIARLDMERRNYPLTVLHEYHMQPADLLATLTWIEKSNLSELRAKTGTSAERMELVPVACEVLRELVAALKPSGIDVSAYGIREGLLYEQMPPNLRARDPLLEAARMAEKTSSRMPGFGKRLFEFLLPLFQDATPQRLRLIKAACLLHDTSWRTHPDFRAEACFDAATRANLGGLDHSGRIFLGLALVHRYKNSRSGSRLEPMCRLLSDSDIQDAEVLGKAMRFGAMFAVRDPSTVCHLTYDRKKGHLRVDLNQEGRDLLGEVALSRLNSLASAMRAETQFGEMV
jgi:exopolyphosphatase/guanosine-5'-triphosphate,3'-diphosphate pyrophosphatase